MLRITGLHPEEKSSIYFGTLINSNQIFHIHVAVKSIQDSNIHSGRDISFQVHFSVLSHEGLSAVRVPSTFYISLYLRVCLLSIQ
jgi:hypothetical protein